MTPASAARSGDRIFLSPDERCAAILDAIKGARSRVLLSLFRANDKRLFEALKSAVDRGVDVQVLVTSRAKGGRRKLQKLWSRLERTGARVHPYSDPVVKYHAKYLVVDEGPALITTLNFTKKCFASTCDAVVETWDPAVVRGLVKLMAADKVGSPAPADLPDRLIVGPERARRQFTALLESAQSRIRLIDAKLSDPDVMALLDRRRAAGILVEVYDDKRVGGAKSHGKIMLVDDTVAVIGSLALAALCLDFRREVAIVCREPGAVEPVRTFFDAIRAGDAASRAGHPATAGDASC